MEQLEFEDYLSSYNDFITEALQGAVDRYADSTLVYDGIFITSGFNNALRSLMKRDNRVWICDNTCRITLLNSHPNVFAQHHRSLGHWRYIGPDWEHKTYPFGELSHPFPHLIDGNI